jgi:hypothetical protein
MSWILRAFMRDSVVVDQVFAYAQRLAAELAGHGEGRLIGAYLHGSAALGGWVPGKSDVDMLFVVADGTGESTLDSMTAVVVAAGIQCPGRDLETSIVAAAKAREPSPPWPYLRHAVAGPAGTAQVVRPDLAAPGDRDLLMHYAVCRAAGRAVFGPAPAELIGPIPRPVILAYLADELAWGLANAPESYAVLNACRAQAYLSDDAIISKIAGGEAALRRGTGPAEVISRALAQQCGHQHDQPPAPDAVEFVLATTAMLRSGS